jgi:hypothetical protein
MHTAFNGGIEGLCCEELPLVCRKEICAGSPSIADAKTPAMVEARNFGTDMGHSRYRVSGLIGLVERSVTLGTMTVVTYRSEGRTERDDQSTKGVANASSFFGISCL